MIPRALRSRPRAMARPARPASEIAAVLAAADIVRVETGHTAADPVAAVIAARVVEEMQSYLDESVDPFLAALGDARRRMLACPIGVLATDPIIDTLGLFVDARVDRLRARSGRKLSSHDDQTECRELWAGIQARLWRRYVKQLRQR